ncbi:MAG: RsmE family RNA methyltransferase [Pleomorphochaeta sp.]
MRQYVLPKYFHGEEILKLNKEDSLYFIKVLRLKINDKIFARDLDGNPYQISIKEVNKNTCICNVKKLNEGDSFISTDALPKEKKEYPKIHLFQCVCKGKKNETIIRMATELGVSSISLVQSQYCIAKKDKSNTQRYEKIIKEAIQQSGSSIITKFNNILSFNDFINSLSFPLFFFHQQDIDNRSLKDKLKNLKTDSELGILIGPEGGLSDQECKILIEKGCIPVTLKTNILRAETASIVALSSIHTLLMER